MAEAGHSEPLAPAPLLPCLTLPLLLPPRPLCAAVALPSHPHPPPLRLYTGCLPQPWALPPLLAHLAYPLHWHMVVLVVVSPLKALQPLMPCSVVDTHVFCL